MIVTIHADSTICRIQRFCKSNYGWEHINS